MTPKIWNKFVPRFETLPSVNQIECNPFSQQKEMRAILEKANVKVECWYPLGHGNAELLRHPTITALSEKYGKDAGQIILRFETQEGFITLPKSANPIRIKSNLDIFDFTLNGEEMRSIRNMDTGKTSHDPDADGVGEYLLNAFRIED